MSMRRRRKRMSFDNNSDRWLLTYADLITLLLAFFVVMYSMSRIDAKQFGKMVKALSGILKGGNEIVVITTQDKIGQGFGLLKLGNLKMLQKKIQEKFKFLGKQEEVVTEITERGLVIHIMESALFRQGSAALELRALNILDLVYDEIANRPNHVRIEGHTDNRSIRSALHASNWELSTARATAVVRYFLDNYDFPPERISALGYGEYRPIRRNNSIANRASNRRVDIVILTMELTLKEPSSQFYNFSLNEQNLHPQPEILSDNSFIGPAFDPASFQ